MAEFLAENNICGRDLLRIVSNGNAIIAELLRLKDYIPTVFRLETKAEQIKYSDIVFDYNYFRVAAAQERKIEENSDLQDLDAEFRDNYIEILNRFYLAFASIHQYAKDLQHFVDELNESYYIQQSLESILQDEEGKQLLCESLYLYGVMLLVTDLHIPGIIRERLLVSHHRYTAQKSHDDSNIDDVCKLLRCTGFSSAPGAKRPPHYPENYFGRFMFDSNFVEMLIGRLRSDDIYNQISVYPHPDHRSTALSTQAGMLFVCLFFAPNILQNKHAQMREITDKFFSDNWVIPIYMGITVNLIDAWEQYAAAKSALAKVVENSAVGYLCLKYSDIMKKVLPKLVDNLKEGILTEQFVIQHLTKIINLLRECNVTLRWLLLHRSLPVLEFGGCKKFKQLLKDTILGSNNQNSEIFKLLLNTSQLELTLREILKALMNEKFIRWESYRKESADRMSELSEAFSGNQHLSKIAKNDGLKLWFAEISKEISSLNHETPSIAGRKIIQLIQAIEEVQAFHNLESNMQVKQYLLEVRKYLHNMVRTINIKEDVLINMQIIGDLSYAWRIIDSGYTQIMQENIKKQPALVRKLRATFLKLASALEIPLLRINQAHSEDLISVSQYYSNELVNYVRKVVQIIPETMFTILSEIIDLQTRTIKEIPARLEKSKLKEYAQLDDRYKVAELTYSISVFTEGILMMKKTLVGVIELDPKQLLEDGIRKELVNHLSFALHNGLMFETQQPQELEQKLVMLANTINGYRRSFEYIQDYLSIHGLKIWQEEFSRIINYNVEKECNNFLRNKVLDWQSIYQSVAVPIPNHPPTGSDLNSNNFIGRLARDILTCTEPKSTIYIELEGSWYDRKTQDEIFDARIFTKIREAIGPAGLVGLNKLYFFMFVTDLQQNVQRIQKNVTTDKMWIDMLDTLTKELHSNIIILNPVKFYTSYTTRWTKVWPKIQDFILSVGHKQILRQHIAYELNSSCKFNCKNLESALQNFNKALLVEVLRHQMDPHQPLPSKKLLHELNEYLEWTGIYDPLEQIFMTTKNSHHVPLFLFLFTISHIPKLTFDKSINCLIAKKTADLIDGYPVIIGIKTVLQQFHRENTDLYLDYLCQYINSLIEPNLSIKNELGSELHDCFAFLLQFARVAKISHGALEKKIPEAVLNQYEYLSSANDG